MLVVDQQVQNTLLVTAWNRECRRCAELSHPPTCCHHKASLMVGLNMVDIECVDCFSKHCAQPEIGKSPGVRTDLTPLGQEPGASSRLLVWPRWELSGTREPWRGNATPMEFPRSLRMPILAHGSISASRRNRNGGGVFDPLHQLCWRVIAAAKARHGPEHGSRLHSL